MSLAGRGRFNDGTINEMRLPRVSVPPKGNSLNVFLTEVGKAMEARSDDLDRLFQSPIGTVFTIVIQKLFISRVEPSEKSQEQSPTEATTQSEPLNDEPDLVIELEARHPIPESNEFYTLWTQANITSRFFTGKHCTCNFRAV